MIQELLYTSYEGQGLRKGGGGGFCTVLSTQGMATNLAAALERLSGYRHPFDIHDPRSLASPVNFQHAVITLGGVNYHVLSRIADLRREHTGRSNKLAHHVVIPGDASLPVGGPSRVLSHPGLCRVDWDNQVKIVPEIPRSALPSSDIPPSVCVTWRQLAGDAGWAGAVADLLLREDVSTVNIIYPLQTDTLALTNEVFLLIPANRRWDISFSTYYTTPIPGSRCDFRFFLDGTPEAQQLRRDYRQTTIDLTSPLKPVIDSPRVEAARTGRPLETAERRPISSKVTQVAVAAKKVTDAEDGLAHVQGSITAENADANVDIELDLVPLPRQTSPWDDIDQSPTRSVSHHPTRVAGRQLSKSPLKVILVAVCALIVLMVMIIGGTSILLVAQGSWSRKEVPKKDDTVYAKDDVEKPTPGEKDVKQKKGKDSDRKEKVIIPTAKSPPPEKTKEADDKKLADHTDAPPQTLPQELPLEPPPPAPPISLLPESDLPFVQPNKHVDRIVLKNVQEADELKRRDDLRTRVLTTLFDHSLDRMELLGLDELNKGIDPAKGRLAIAKRDDSANNLFIDLMWQNGIDKEAKSRRIAIVSQSQDGICFQWTSDAFEQATALPDRGRLVNGLRFCQLVLSSSQGDQHQYFQLWSPLSKCVVELVPLEAQQIDIPMDILGDVQLPPEQLWRATCALRPSGLRAPAGINVEPSKGDRTGQFVFRNEMERSTVAEPLLTLNYELVRPERNNSDPNYKEKGKCPILALKLSFDLSLQHPDPSKITSLKKESWDHVFASVNNLVKDTTKKLSDTENELKVSIPSERDRLNTRIKLAKGPELEHLNKEKQRLEDRRVDLEAKKDRCLFVVSQQKLLNELKDQPLRLEIANLSISYQPEPTPPVVVIQP